jgi:hypothetical protein
LKKAIFLPAVFLLCLSFALAFVPEVDFQPNNNAVKFFAMVFLVIEIIFVLTISANLVRFINITKRNKAFVFVYATISLFLFNSIINIFYFISKSLAWNIDYIYIYSIERLTIVVAFVMITVGFLKFNKHLRTR